MELTLILVVAALSVALLLTLAALSRWKSYARTFEHLVILLIDDETLKAESPILFFKGKTAEYIVSRSDYTGRLRVKKLWMGGEKEVSFTKE